MWPSEADMLARRLVLGRRVGVWLVLLAVAFASLSVGCSQRRRWHKHPKLMTEQDAVKCVRIALEDPLPDERRAAIDRLAQSRYLQRDVVIDALLTIARTDRSEAVRCAAVRAATRSQDPRVVETMITVLRQDREIRPATARLIDVRADALRSILVFAHSDALPAEQTDGVRDVAVESLTRDPSRDVRQAAAAVLGFVPERVVLEPLIVALEMRDFGVVYEAERSLMRLTGYTFDHDARAWREWLAQTANPFADAGRLDEFVDPPEKSWWAESIEEARQVMTSFKPKTDES